MAKTVDCKTCRGTGKVSIFENNGVVAGLIGFLFIGTKENCETCGGKGEVQARTEYDSGTHDKNGREYYDPYKNM